MENRAYLLYAYPFSMGFLSEVKVEKFKWTGRMQFKTVNGHQTIYAERRATFLGIPLWRTWENENRFKFYEVEVEIVECTNEN